MNANTEYDNRILEAIALEIDGYIDGAPDASDASKLANRISLIIGNQRPKPLWPKGSVTPITDTAEFTDGHASTLNPMVHSVVARDLEIENNQLKDALKNLRDYCAAQGWDISTSNRVAEPANDQAQAQPPESDRDRSK